MNTPRVEMIGGDTGHRAEYVCAACGGTFEKEWTDQEAWAEGQQLFGGGLTPENAVQVCDVCWRKLLANELASRKDE